MDKFISSNKENIVRNPMVSNRDEQELQENCKKIDLIRGSHPLQRKMERERERERCTNALRN